MKKYKNKLKILVASIILIILMNEIIPFLKANNEEIPSQYLFLKNPANLNYKFIGKGECYLVAEIENIDFINLTLDGKEYLLSYGLNIIPICFSDDFEVHSIILPENPSYFIKTLSIEPLFLSEGSVDTSLDEETIIQFEAGGPISILLQPNFSYNWLFVKLDGHIHKKVYDIADYPEIDSQLYSYFVEKGAYCQFSITIEPGVHDLILKGNGTVNYKIIVNSDWDNDDLSDVEEVQKELLFDLDPTIADVWGFFQKGDNNMYWNSSENSIEELKDGFFNFYIPSDNIHSLKIEVYDGEFIDFKIDGNNTLMNNIILHANYPNTSIDAYTVPISNKGWHYIQYKYKSGLNRINFKLNGKNITLITPSELRDGDADGIKDIEEDVNELGIDTADTDKDGLPDNYDASPKASLILEKDKIHQFLIPTKYENNSIITIQIKKPEKDYSTYDTPLMWRDTLNVSIYAVLRLFGHQFQLDDQSPIEQLTNIKLTELWGKNISTYSLIESNFGKEGDPLPKGLQTNNETAFIFPRPADNIFEYQFNIPKNHLAKEDGILDLRFDFIWLITWNKENATEILHFYDFEEDIILQSITHRETGSFNYIVGSPDDFIESQTLWLLSQNPNLSISQDNNVLNDIISQGTVDYFNIGTKLMNIVENYYTNNKIPENEQIVFYSSGLQDIHDILHDIIVKNDEKSHINNFDYQGYFSFYVYSQAENNSQTVEQKNQADYKVLYQNTPDNFSLLYGMPIDVKIESFSNFKVLTIIEAVSEQLPVTEIPYCLDQNLNESIILKKSIYIEEINNDYHLNFDPERDFCKLIFDNRAGEIESGKLFFEKLNSNPSKLSIFQDHLNTLRLNLKDLHQELLSYQSNEEDDFHELFQGFSNILDNYRDESGEYLSLKSFSMSIDEKFNALRLIEDSLTDFIFKSIKKLTLKELAEEIDRIIFTAKLSSWNLAARKLVFNLDTIHPSLETKDAINALISKQNMQLKIAKGIYIARIALSILALVTDIIEMVLLLKQKNGYSDMTVEYIHKISIEIFNIAVDCISIFIGIYELTRFFAAKTAETATKLTKYLSKINIIIGIIIILIEVGTFIEKVINKRFIDSAEFTIQLLDIIFQVGMFIGTILCAHFWETIWGLIIGLMMIGATIACQLLTAGLNYIEYDASFSRITFSNETKLNIRRHGSLEVGDEVNFKFIIVFVSTDFIWAWARFRLEGEEGWVSPYDNWKGRWGLLGGKDCYNYWKLVDLYNEEFNTEIIAPTVNLKFRYQFYMDVNRVYFLPFPPHVLPLRSTYIRGEDLVEIVETGLPVLDNNISEFYDDTIQIINVEKLKEKFNQSINSYQYKDAYDIATEIITQTQEQANIVPAELENINLRKQEYNDTYSKIQTQDNEEFMYLIEKYFDEGFRAETLIPESIRETLENQEEKYINLVSYSESNGVIVFEKSWIYDKLEQLGDAVLYQQLRSELPIKTNINFDLGQEIFTVNPLTGRADLDLKLNLKGADNPQVNIIIEPPNGFLINPSQLFQNLASNMILTIQDTDQILIMGLYYFKLTVYLNDTIIYQKDVPFSVPGYTNVTMNVFTPIEEIVPGETVCLVNVTNQGTKSEIVQFVVEGIPEDFIVEGLYPEEFENSILSFEILPGETRRCLLIKPPRNHNTIAGIYYFNLTLKDLYHDIVLHTYQSSFVVAKFYELDFQCSNPDITIFDNETCSYQFTITNLGNSEEEYTITCTDIGIASYYLEENIFTLTPGQTKSFNIILYPINTGKRIFIVNIKSEHVYKHLPAIISINDDDLNSPLFTIEAINCISDEVPGFWRIIAEDESGIQKISLIIDGEQLNFTQDDFDFNNSVEILIPINNELGTHTCEGYAIDADLDLGDIDQLTTIHPLVSCYINDDDINSPILSNLIISDTIHDISIFFEVFDTSGVKEVMIGIDNKFTITYDEFSENLYNFDIFNYWIMDFGIHYVEIEVWDADEDRIEDSLSSLISGTFITSFEDMKQYIIWEIDQLIACIYESADDWWWKKNERTTMVKKLDALKALIAENLFEDAYHKLLHDIKPKLTGLKTDENENPFGNGLFKSPWVINDNFQKELRLLCNELLKYTNTIIETSQNLYFEANNYRSLTIIYTNGYSGTHLYSIFLLIGLISLLILNVINRRKNKLQKFKYNTFKSLFFLNPR